MPESHATTVAPAEEQCRTTRPGVLFRRLTVAFPNFMLAAAYVLTWIYPHALGQDAVRYGMLTMMLEFIVMHSSLFIASVIYSHESSSRRLQNTLGLALVYTAFAAGFAVVFETWWPVFAIGGLMLNHVAGLLIGDTPRRDKEDARRYKEDYMRAGWGLSVLYYLCGLFLTSILPIPIPELGVTAGVRQALNLPGEGLWVDAPQEVLAFGAIYFGLTGIGELFGRYERHWDLDWRESESASVASEGSTRTR